LTEDAVQMTPEGPICGRQAIQKKYADLFEQSHPTNMVCTIDWVNAVGNVLWNSGEWTCTLQGENGPLCIKGYRLDVLVREGDAWRS
jgi:ketosteroid isomerase-like protein